MSGKKNSRKKDGGDISTVLDKLANVALCLVGISVPCFVFDAFWWGVAALAVAAVIILAITAIFLFVQFYGKGAEGHSASVKQAG